MYVSNRYTIKIHLKILYHIVDIPYFIDILRDVMDAFCGGQEQVNSCYSALDTLCGIEGLCSF